MTATRSEKIPLIDETHGFCRECHYPLFGLTQGRCPECGGAFDPEDPGTFLLDFNSPTLVLLAKRLTLAGLPAVVITELACRALLHLEFSHPRRWVCGNAVESARELYRGFLTTALVLALFALLGAYLLRRTPSAVLWRCLAWTAAIWWLGWRLAIWYALF